MLQGFVPSDVELLPRQKDKVHDAIREIWNTSTHFLPWNSPTNSTPSSGHDSSRASFHSSSSRHLRSVSPEDEVLHNTRSLHDECEVGDVVESLQVHNTLEQLKNRQIELSRKELSSEEPESLDDAGLLAISRSESTSRIGSSGMFGTCGLESEKKNHVMESGRQGVVSSSTCPQGTIDDACRCDNNNSQVSIN